MDIKVGAKFIDTNNEFNNPNFEFILGEKYNHVNAIVEVLELTKNSVYVDLKRHPIRYYKKNGEVRLSKTINCRQWYTINEFNNRFKLIN